MGFGGDSGHPSVELLGTSRGRPVRLSPRAPWQLSPGPSAPRLLSPDHPCPFLRLAPLTVGGGLKAGRCSRGPGWGALSGLGRFCWGAGTAPLPQGCLWCGETDSEPGGCRGGDSGSLGGLVRTLHGWVGGGGL